MRYDHEAAGFDDAAMQELPKDSLLAAQEHFFVHERTTRDDR